jgi:hypothetical protein
LVADAAGDAKTNYSGTHVACAAGKEDDVRPRPEARQSQIRDRETARPVTDLPQAEAVVALSEEQRRVIDALQTQRHGMTVRQLEARLSQPRGIVELLLESLLERQLVARLNTLVPSYMYRYRGVDLNDE